MDDAEDPEQVADQFSTTSAWNARTPLLTAGLAILVVVATWLLGHLPWVVDGFQISPHGAEVGANEGLDGVRLAIPLIAGELPALVAFTAIGATAATLLPLAFSDLSRSLAVVVSVLVLAITTLVLAVAARSSIQDHARDAFAGDQRVLDGLVLGVLVVAAAAGLLGALASYQVGFLPLATAVVVGQLPIWLGHLDVDSARSGTVHDLVALTMLSAAFVISVRRSAAWALLWPVALAIVWIATPLQIGTSAMADRLRPGASLEQNLPDVFAQGLELFQRTFWDAPQTWWPGVVAAGLGLVWVAGRHVAALRDG